MSLLANSKSASENAHIQNRLANSKSAEILNRLRHIRSFINNFQMMMPKQLEKLALTNCWHFLLKKQELTLINCWHRHRRPLIQPTNLWPIVTQKWMTVFTNFNEKGNIFTIIVLASIILLFFKNNYAQLITNLTLQKLYFFY